MEMQSDRQKAQQANKQPGSQVDGYRQNDLVDGHNTGDLFIDQTDQEGWGGGWRLFAAHLPVFWAINRKTPPP